MKKPELNINENIKVLKNPTMEAKKNLQNFNVINTTCSNNAANNSTTPIKKIKFKIEEKVIFGLIREPSNVSLPEVEKPKSPEAFPMKISGRKRRKEGSFNTGRWMPDEHQRFIEALLKHGNEWKSVQKYVGTRSSTQARSHAQKFFVKIGKTQIENLQLDFENNSLKSLNLLANNLNSEQMAKAIKTLNKIAFDKKNSGRKSGNVGNSGNNSSNDKLDTSSLGNENYLPLLEGNHNGYTLTKRKRIRTSKKEKKDNIIIIPKYDKDDSISTVTNSNENFKLINNLSQHYNHFRNRRYSIDLNYPLNFLNENSIFNNLNNPTSKYFNINPADDKDFQLIFENSFKFNENEINFDQQEELVLFFDEKSQHSQHSQNSQNTLSRKSSSEILNEFNDGKLNNDDHADVIEQFLDC